MSLPTPDTNTLWDIVEIYESAKKDPNILNEYPKEFSAILAAALKKNERSTAGVNSIADIENEITNIREELETFGNQLKHDEDGQLMVAYMRLKTQVLTKMIDIQERTFNLKTMKQFQERVLTAFDKILTAEQRTKVTHLLEGKDI